MYIIICGPTATGKTEIAAETAKLLNTEIISADSMQVYKGMDIGTSKAGKAEKKGIKHHLIDIISPSAEFTAAEFKTRAETIMKKMERAGKIPVICGGTGLYINSVIRGLFETPKPKPEIRKRLKKDLKEKGIKNLLAVLKKKDRAAWEQIDRNNPRRVLRALEIIESAGIKFSGIKKKTAKTVYTGEYIIFVLNMKKKALYERINLRVDKMEKKGLIGEVRWLLEQGVDADCVSMQGIGYKETVMYLRGEIDKEAMLELVKKNTRNYAKRQVTWFKRYKEAEWIDVEGKSAKEIARHIVQTIMEFT